MASSDRDLIASCLRGEQHAWTELIARYQRLIYSVARGLCPQPEDCADVFQRVCMELYQGLSRIRNDQTLPAWLITVTRRSSYAVLRARRTTIPIEDFEAASDQKIHQIEKEFVVERAVAELPDRCRALIQFLYFDVNEPSYEHISQRLGMPVASIGPTRARCLEKLKKILES